MRKKFKAKILDYEKVIPYKDAEELQNLGFGEGSSKADAQYDYDDAEDDAEDEDEIL